MRLHIIIFFFTLHIYTQSNPTMSYYFGDETTYNEKIPTPESILGYSIGQWHLSHDKIVKYLQILSESSNRIKYKSRGETFEGRPLILLIITSEKNHEKLNTIKKEHIDAVPTCQRSAQLSSGDISRPREGGSRWFQGWQRGQFN